MVTVDSNGRIVLPEAVRVRLGITPGTEVDIYRRGRPSASGLDPEAVHEENGKVVVKPEDDPEEIIERMERLVEETSSRRGETTPLDD
jgi:AbrB family looped-hinge helix DNA binding protein